MNLNQVTVSSSDIDKSIQFYTQLGLKLIVHSSNQYARFQCPNGLSTFSVQLDDEFQVTHSTSIYFEVQSLDEKVQKLINSGIEIDKMPEDKVWLWREAYLKDPDGHRIILYFAGENRLNPPWKLK